MTKESGERKINWFLISSVLFGLIVALLGWFVQQNERRVLTLEVWRIEHERSENAQTLLIRTELAEIKTKLDRLILDQHK